MSDEEIINEWCAVLEKHGLYVSPVRYVDLLEFMTKVRMDTEHKIRMKKLYANPSSRK